MTDRVKVYVVEFVSLGGDEEVFGVYSTPETAAKAADIVTAEKRFKAEITAWYLDAMPIIDAYGSFALLGGELSPHYHKKTTEEKKE